MLFRSSVKLLKALCERLRVPNECRELAEVVAREHGNIHRSQELDAAAVMRLLGRCDAIRQPERFALVLQACACDARGRLGLGDAPYPQAAHLQHLLDCALSVDTQALSTQALAEGVQGEALGRRIEQARVQAMARAMKQAE